MPNTMIRKIQVMQNKAVNSGLKEKHVLRMDIMNLCVSDKQIPASLPNSQAQREEPFNISRGARDGSVVKEHGPLFHRTRLIPSTHTAAHNGL